MKKVGNLRDLAFRDPDSSEIIIGTPLFIPDLAGNRTGIRIELAIWAGVLNAVWYTIGFEVKLEGKHL
jgi:hypothetical protein